MAGEEHTCGAQRHLRRLLPGEMAVALGLLSPHQRAECLRLAGLRVRAGAPAARAAQLLLARLRTVDGTTGHNVVVTLTEPARLALMSVLSDDEQAIVDDVAQGLDGPLAPWPRPVLASLFALMCEIGGYDAFVRDQLVALVDGAAGPDPEAGSEGGVATNAGPGAGSTPPDALTDAEGGAEAAVPQRPASSAGGGSPGDGAAAQLWSGRAATGRQPLDAVVAAALRRAFGGDDGSDLAGAVAAVDELLALDGHRPGSWWLRGLADGMVGVAAEEPADGQTAGLGGTGADGPNGSEREGPGGEPAPGAGRGEEADGRRAPTRDLARQRLAGHLAALAHRGEAEALAALAAQHGHELAAIVADEGSAELVAPLLRALVDRDEPAVATLLAAATRPFPRWPEVVEHLRLAANREGAADVATPVHLLRAGDDMLTGWTPSLSTHQLRTVERAAAELAVARVSCQRRAGDFRGARSVLARINPHVLSPPARRHLADEAALVAMEVRDLETVAFPRSDGEREAGARRAARAGTELEDALAHGSPATGRVLSALAAVAEGRTGDAVADLRLAAAALATQEDQAANRLVRTVEFQLGLHELCLLEPASEPGALARIEWALGAGHQASADELATVAVALDAHGSEAAVAMVARALELAPRHPGALEVLAGLARQGSPQAGQLAHAAGGDDRLSRRTRYELLDAALTAACRAPEALAVEAVADDLERLVVSAADADLDLRWASRLATDDGLRSVLDPVSLDLVRLHVLRRSGHTDEAAGLALGLYHRCLAGHVEGVEPADLLELVAALGVSEDQVVALRRLLPPGPAEDGTPRPDAGEGSTPGDPGEPAPVLVLFVGGNESQARMWPAVEADVATRYGEAVTVEWFMTGWTSNWAPLARAIECRYGEADAVVLMTFVRTMLGRRLRRTAGEADLPWVACTGHGRSSLDAAIDRAVTLARSRARSAAGREATAPSAGR